MNIGIISINKYAKHLNYGAALHSYAFQKYLDKHGIENTIIDYKPRFMMKYSLKYPFLTPPERDKFKKIGFWLLSFFPNIRKYKKFELFFKNHYRSTKTKYTPRSIREAKLRFDTIICESDVIWSPHSTGGFEDAYFCNLPSMRGKKKIAYAACIGYYNFTVNQQKQFSKLMDNFDGISIREVQGVEFAQEFTDKKIYNVLDPTLLLDANDYEEIVVEPKEKEYILVYNCLKNDRKMLRDANRLGKKKGLKVIEISVYLHNFYRNKVKVSVGLEEFLGYFKNASYVLTNAFHGVCFALVYKKDFYTYARGTKDSRVTSILGLLELDYKFIDDMSVLPDEWVEADYTNVYKRLNVEREKSKQFLFDVLES